ncbi:MAG: O-antigen ligase family protein [Thioalkalivibrio sp.]
MLFPFSMSHQLPQLILAIIGLTIIFRKHTEAWNQPEVRLFLVVYSLIFVPLVISMFSAADMDKAISTSARYLAFLFIGLAVLLSSTRRSLTPVLLWAVVIIPSIWVFDGLVQHFSGTNLLGYPTANNQVTGMFYPKRGMGIFLAHLAPLYLEALRRLSPGRPWLWLLVIPYVTVVLLGGSRSSWMTLLLTLLAYSAYLAVIYQVSWKRVVSLGATIILAAILTTSFSTGLQERLERTAGVLSLDFEQWDHATSNRMTIWSAAIRVFQDHWLTGVGARGFTPVAMDSGYMDFKYSHVHLFILEIPVATGVLGLAAYLAVLAVLIIWFMRQKGRRRVLFAPWLAIMLVLFPLNVHWHFYGTYFTSLFWFIFLVGMIISRETRAQVEHHESAPTQT